MLLYLDYIPHKNGLTGFQPSYHPPIRTCFVCNNIPEYAGVRIIVGIDERPFSLSRQAIKPRHVNIVSHFEDAAIKN